MRGHADAETLAAFREELLSRRKAARVSAHLATCTRCRTLDAQLAGVTALLSRTTAPPMPGALTARIQAALAAEAAGRGSAPATSRPATSRRATSRRAGSPGPSRTRLALRVATVAAAVAIVAGGGYGVVRLLSGGPSLTTGSAASGAGSAARKSVIPRMSTGSFHSASGPLAAPAGAAAGTRVVSSGTNYQRATLGAQASAVLARLGPDAHASAGPAPSRAAARNQAAFSPNLPTCVAHVAGTQHPLLEDMARYQSRPALILVLPGPPGTLRALVIAPGCTATKSHILAAATLPSSR